MSTSRIIELATLLAEWQRPPQQPVSRPTYAFGDDPAPMSRDEWDRQIQENQQRVYGAVDEMISEFLPLFAAADFNDRLDAARLIRRPASKPVWDAFWQWNPPHNRDDEWMRINYVRDALVKDKMPAADPRDLARLHWPPTFALTRSDPDWTKWMAEVDRVITMADRYPL